MVKSVPTVMEKIQLHHEGFLTRLLVTEERDNQHHNKDVYRRILSALQSLQSIEANSPNIFHQSHLSQVFLDLLPFPTPCQRCPA